MTDSQTITLTSPRPGSRAGDKVRLGCAIVSLALCVFLSGLYLLRPDGWDPITIWPFVFWAWVGLVFAAASLSRQAKRRSLVVIGVWVVVLLTINEEPRSLLRSVGHGGEKAWRDARAEGRALRVVSLNCAGGILAVASEAAALDPDIVLLQERPGMGELEDVFPESEGWQGTASLDTAVLVLGELDVVPVSTRESVFLSVARVRPDRLASPRELAVASIHLTLPYTRADIWRRGVWRAAEEIRQVRVGQMGRVVAYAEEVAGQPMIFGGDFNTPGGDGLFRPMRAYLRDAFYEAGVGWPDTMVNDSPVSRIDQVWISDGLEATTLRAIETRNSDHRMVVCDLVVRR